LEPGDAGDVGGSTEEWLTGVELEGPPPPRETGFGVLDGGAEV